MGTGDAPRTARSRGDARERILTAAYACLDRHGVKKTTVEMIAAEAGLSRPTVYKYFPRGKPDIVDYVATVESLRVHMEVKRRVSRGHAFSDTITEVIFLTARIGGRNAHIRRVAEDYVLVGWRSRATGEMSALHRKWWQKMLSDAAASGELARDLSHDEVLSWISVMESMLLLWTDNLELDDALLRRIIRRFLVDPLLAAPERS